MGAVCRGGFGGSCSKIGVEVSRIISASADKGLVGDERDKAVRVCLSSGRNWCNYAFHHPLFKGSGVSLVEAAVEYFAGSVIDRDHVGIDIGSEQGRIIEGESLVGEFWQQHEVLVEPYFFEHEFAKDELLPVFRVDNVF